MKTVFEVDPNDIEFAAFNPRGEKPKDIESDPSFVQLKDSVFKYGVLVPLVIREQAGAGRKLYRLIDGERRLRAALDTIAKRGRSCRDCFTSDREQVNCHTCHKD